MTTDPSKYSKRKGAPRLCEVVLAEGSYFVCPIQFSFLQSVEGKKISLLPVSKLTVYDTGSDGNL